MFRSAQEINQNYRDVSAFVDTIRSADGLFSEEEIFIARAPGRLDVMGGIADYSGSLVLEMPIAEAALVALQKNDERILKIVSLGAEENNRTNSFEMALDEFEKDGRPVSYREAADRFRRNKGDGWAGYIAGVFFVLMREKEVRFERGARILIDSKVPEGKGVSSSAAIEVATMSAVAGAFGIEIGARESAILCQKVENLIVGAPCGVMDQMSSSCGEANRLLSMICQPAELQREAVDIPPELAVWGIDSGIRHSVGAGDYGSVRTGAFMGYRIIAELAGLKISLAETSGVVRIEDDKWNGYLANVTPDEFEGNYAAQLPQEISGAEFLERYRGITDTVTQIKPDKNYAVFYPARHPIYENFRVHRFAKLLNAPLTESSLSEIGRLMYASHESYSACGLGTSGTDMLIELVKNSEALYGAKITGGGSGGTVAVLGLKEAEPEIKKIAEIYERETGHRPYIFSGSSPGAGAFGNFKINI